MLKVYIAGPMSNVPQFNYPAFDLAAEQLRAIGYTVVTPSELDEPEVRALALTSKEGSVSDLKGLLSWGEALARDIKIVADQVDTVALLPGWQKSRGARLEAFVGLLCRRTFFEYNPRTGVAEDVPPHYIMAEINRNMVEIR